MRQDYFRPGLPISSTDIAGPTGQQLAIPESGTVPIAQLADLPPAGNLPALLSDLVGREVQLTDVAELVGAHRLVTLVGVGGIGKTRFGLEAVRCLQPKFADGVWVVALGSLSDSKLVLPTVAAVLGQSDSPETPAHLATALAAKRFLLMLDNCEHVIDAAAGIAEAFLHASATVQVLATSWEPLGIAGECVYRVPALDVPAEGTTDIEDVSRHSAVRLFLERTGAMQRSLRLDAHVVTAATAICRRLDGIPLAIELAAGRAATLGVHGLASRLDDPFKLLTEGHRTAPARHQTLRAALDWSYELLSEPERAVMRRLSIFAGDFTVEAAVSVAAIADTTASNVVNCLAGLVTKSLVAADVGSAAVRYRLLETIRTYVVEKLAGSSDWGQVARRYAALDHDRCEPTAIDWPRLSSDELFCAADLGMDNMDNMPENLECARFAKDDTATAIATAATRSQGEGLPIV